MIRMSSAWQLKLQLHKKFSGALYGKCRVRRYNSMK